MHNAVLYNKLLKKLKNNPISVKEFIEICLYDPIDGYYSKQCIFGKQGDYVTAPELTPLFGQMLALWCLNILQSMSGLFNVTLIELGPGNGTMMLDMLNIWQKFKHLYKTFNVCLIEKSGSLMAKQQSLLSNYNINYLKNIEDINANEVVFVIANEFFDALPIEQYIYQNDIWAKREIGLIDNKISFLGNKAPKIKQYCPFYEHYIHKINSLLLNACGGGALIIDYGDYASQGHVHGDTLQALYKHQKTQVFDNIGMQDITHSVDFGHLIRLVDQNLKYNLETQGNFLLKLGIEQLLRDVCAKSINPSQHYLCGLRLISPQEMGSLFKVLFIIK